MQKQNTRSLLQKYLTERMMSNSTRTDIFASDLEGFEFYLDMNGLDKIRIGFYTKKPNKWASEENYILYEIPDDTETQELVTVITLTHGSIEKAFNLQKSDNIMSSTFPWIPNAY